MDYLTKKIGSLWILAPGQLRPGFCIRPNLFVNKMLANMNPKVKNLFIHSLFAQKSEPRKRTVTALRNGYVRKKTLIPWSISRCPSGSANPNQGGHFEFFNARCDGFTKGSGGLQPALPPALTMQGFESEHRRPCPPSQSSGFGRRGTQDPRSAVSSSEWSLNKIIKKLIITLLFLFFGATPAFAGELANQFTVSLWVNPLTSVTSKALAVKNTEIRLYTDASGYATCAIHNGTSWQTAAADTTALPLNTWSFVSCTYDKTTLRIFVNGVQKGTSALAVTVNDAATNWRVGSDEAGTYGDLAGTTDEFKIYNYARSQKQIVEDMNAGHPAGGSPVGSQVGYWKFDEGYGTTAYNSGTGSSLNGTITGAVWNNNGKFGKALSFVEGTHYVRATTSTNYSAENSASLWVNLNNTNNRYVMDWGTLNNNWIEVLAGGKIRAGTTPTGTGYCDSVTTLTTGTWYHIVRTYDGTTSKTYINGKFECSKASSANTTGNITIGTAGDLRTSINGLLDEVKIYNYALTSDEVKTDYNKGAAIVFGNPGNASSSASTAYCIPGDTSTCTAPVGEWNFEEGTRGTSYDSSGNGNNGTDTGTTVVSGKIGKARNFNGSSDYVQMPDAANLRITGDVTIGAWIKPTGPLSGSNKFIISKQGNGNNFAAPYIFSLTTSNAKMAILRGDGTSHNSITATNAVPLDNQWHYVVVTQSGTTVTHYLDGVSNGSATLSQSTADAGQPVYIGSQKNTGAFFPGSIDQVRIYNYARTAAQVAWDYNRGAPVARYKFDECQGATVYDLSGKGNNGTITIGASGTQTAVGNCSTSATTAWYSGRTGKYNSSLNFDGTDDYVTVTPSSNTSINITGNDTVSSWIYPTAFGNYYLIIDSQTSAGTENNQYNIYLDSNNKFNRFLSGSACTSNTSLSSNVWYNLVSTYDGTNIRLYLNGVLDKTCTTSKPSVTTNVLRIGTRNGASSYNFRGQIDDVRIYNYALTATQIKTLYNENASVRFGPSTGTP